MPDRVPTPPRSPAAIPLAVVPSDAGAGFDRELTRLAEQAAAHTPGGCGVTVTAVAARDVAAPSGPDAGHTPRPEAADRLPRTRLPAHRPAPANHPAPHPAPQTYPATPDPRDAPDPRSVPGTPDTPVTSAAPDEAEVVAVEVEQRLTAATHPDLSALVAAQLSRGEGPIPAALRTGRPSVAEDLLRERRWPHYRADALAVGVRTSLTLPFAYDGLDVTITLYGLRPGVLGPADRERVELLGDLTVANLVCARRYRAALVEVDQLDTALRTRPVVDQACGILMHITGRDAPAAFDLLRRMSQRSQRKLAELAETVVRSRGRGLEEQLLTFGRTTSPAPGPRARSRG
ncbi:ANTAR domain-containing protein [Streptomyces sp. NPDC057702]|uniref:ANTAR domain-containing protein n=1 Tax=unclassified Streptomyces TaxID=2593676 RepID=UPI003690C944